LPRSSSELLQKAMQAVYLMTLNISLSP